MPKVSVVIPTYNCSRFLGEAIQSVLNQTFQDFEIIIVDDGSTDNTKEVVDSFAHPQLKYIYQENQGVSAARNRGIQLSHGEYIALLDSDDIWLPQMLELEVKALDPNPQAGMVYSDLYYYDSTSDTITGTSWQSRKEPPPRGRVLDQFIEKFWARPSTWLVKRNVFDQIGMFDETLKNCEDEDMLLRMASCFEFEVVPVPLAKCRLHPRQLSRESESALYYQLAYLNKAIQSLVLTNKMRARLRKKLAKYHFAYARFLLLRRGKLSAGGQELLASIKASPLMFLPLVVSFCVEKLIRLFALMRMQVFRGIKAEEM